MEFIGDEMGAAPRLADTRLELSEAEDAFAQSLNIMVDLLKLGKVHGDYSTYNLLWWEGRVVAIDFPQVVDLEENPEAWDLLERERALALQIVQAVWCGGGAGAGGARGETSRRTEPGPAAAYVASDPSTRTL